MNRIPDIDRILEKIYQIIRLFKPELWKWLVRILVISGLSLLCRPFWQAVIEAILDHELGINARSMDITGWILLITGILIYVVERKAPKVAGEVITDAPSITSDEGADLPQPADANSDSILRGRRAERSHLMAAATRRARVLNGAGYPMESPTENEFDDRLRCWGMVPVMSTSIMADIVPVSETDYVEFCHDVELPLPEYLRSTPPRDDLPIVFVSAFEADAYAKWFGKRLPSLAEWRNLAFLRPDGSRSLYPWGNTFFVDYCNSLQSGIGQRTPFTKYLTGRSHCGGLDLAGNTWDWLRDWDGPNRLAIGGSYYDNSKYCRDGEEIKWDPAGRVKDIGFRCVIDAPG